MNQMHISARTLTVAFVAVAVLAFGVVWAGTSLANQGNANAVPDGKVGVCHMTGSEENPSNFIIVSENAVKAHESHGDIIDVESEDECPTGEEGSPAPPPIATPVD